MRHVISFTAWDRPHYLQPSLASWRQARGVETADLMFRVEPGNDEVLSLCSDADFGASLSVTVNPERYGESRNPWEALQDGFATGAGFVILGEDDDVVSDDILDYFTWAADRYEHDEHILAVCAFQQYRKPGGPGGVVLEAFHQPWIWGTWADRWENILSGDWDFDYSHKGFDWHIRERHVQQARRACVFPCESRSQQIGREGVHFTPAVYDQFRSYCFQQHYPVVGFTEVT